MSDLKVKVSSNTQDNGAYLTGDRSRGTQESPIAVTTNDTLGGLIIKGYDGSSFRSSLRIKAIASGTWDATSGGTEITIHTANTSGDESQRLTINQEGLVGIGTASPSYLLDVGGDLHISGSLYVDGSSFVTLTEIVEIEDNVIVINKGESGSGVSAGTAGIQIDRGSSTDYQIIFQESDDTVRIGELGSTQAIATREDSPTDTGVAFWNTSNGRFETSSSITFDGNSKLNLSTGTGINEFSIDGTLAGDSDDAVPTEKAVKTYVDASIAGPLEALNEPTGFPNRTDSEIAFIDASAMLTISPTGASFSIWQMGTEYTFTETQSVVISNNEGMHAVYFDEGILYDIVNPTGPQTADLITNKVLVSYLYWDVSTQSAIYVGEERHGVIMDGNTHSYLHFVNGLRYMNGLGLTDILADESGDVNTHAQFGVSSGAARDEDIYYTISTIASTTGLPIYYRTGANGYWAKVTNAGYSVTKTGTGGEDRLAYNQWTGATWQLTEVTDNYHVLCHVFATTEKDLPMIAIVGRSQYNLLATARDGAETEIREIFAEDTLSPEIRPIATLIFQTKENYGNTMKARVVTTPDDDEYIDWRSEVIERVSISTSEHNALSGLQGGAPGEYYHVIAGTQGSVAFWGTGNN